MELATLQWVHWFSNIRPLEPIGYIPSAEAESNYWWQLAQKAEAASSTSTNQPLGNPGRFSKAGLVINCDRSYYQPKTINCHTFYFGVVVVWLAADREPEPAVQNAQYPYQAKMLLARTVPKLQLQHLFDSFGAD